MINDSYKIFTTAEAIQYLRLRELGIAKPENTLRNYREKGKLRGTYLGKFLVYTKKSLDEFIDGQTK